MGTTVKLTATGREITARRINGLGSKPDVLRWGTGTEAALDGNTALGNQSAESATSVTSSVVTTTTTNDTYRVVGTLTSNSIQVITEAGLFDGSNNLFIRANFDGISLQQGDSVQFTIDGQYIAPS